MRCPVCRAENGPADHVCRRCRAELSLLVALEQQRAREMRHALECLNRGEPGTALEHASRAQDLRRSEDASRLLALAHLMLGDLAQAWKCYRTCVVESST